jgi:hypothetical protein
VKNSKGKLELRGSAGGLGVVSSDASAARPIKVPKEANKRGQQEGLVPVAQPDLSFVIFLKLFLKLCNFIAGGAETWGCSSSPALRPFFVLSLCLSPTHSFGLSLFLGATLAIKWRCAYIPSAKAF